MSNDPGADPFHGIFQFEGVSGRLRQRTDHPKAIPDPDTGRRLRISTIEMADTAICPACAGLAPGGYVSFEDDLRIAFACPRCREFVWIRGA
jgi:hypothetical protein